MISCELENKTLKIFVEGDFSIKHFPEFQACYEDRAFDEVVIDFSNTDHIDSGGLGMLLQLRTNLGSDGNNITLKGLSVKILKVFEVVNFEKLFKMA